MTKSIDHILHIMADRDLPDPCPDGVPCCDGYAYIGPHACLCWEPVYEDGQQEPRREAEHLTRPSMCVDCAFRPGSPERRDSEQAACSSGDLLRIVHNREEVFACHDGLRKGVGWRHPNGMFVHVDPRDGVVPYSPPIEGRRAYRLDGSPALHCAGLAAARRAKDWLP